MGIMNAGLLLSVQIEKNVRALSALPPISLKPDKKSAGGNLRRTVVIA
jgi:hypothetical protein